jgi:hypothetical protein
MRWPFAEACEPPQRMFGNLYEGIRREAKETGVSALVTPVDPFNRSRVLAPVIAAAGVVSVLVLSGVAVGAMVTAAAALLAVYYLLTQVFGYELTVAMPGTA